MMISRGVIVIAFAAALASVGAAAQSLNVTGRWAVSQERCAAESIAFGADGRFASSLDSAEPRQGGYRTGADRIILVADDEPDRELALILIDLTPTRLVAFDETIEADRRLVRCR